MPHCGLHENSGQGFCMNLRIILIGEVITDIGYKSVAFISPLVCFSTPSAKLHSRKFSRKGFSVALPVNAMGWKIKPLIISVFWAANRIMSPTSLSLRLFMSVLTRIISISYLRQTSIALSFMSTSSSPRTFLLNSS